MEKNIPHYPLHQVKQFAIEGQIRYTVSALNSANLFGLGPEDITEIVKQLKPKQFYKSMTTHANHTIWQDVYHPEHALGTFYLKLTLLDNLMIISFKEL